MYEVSFRRLVRVCLMVTALAALCQMALAVALDEERRLTVVLDDGTSVNLIGARGDAAKIKYYYLPTNLHLSMKPDGTPQFLFIKYTTEEREDQGGVQGALLHFLMEWGLTPDQEKALRDKLKQMDGEPELAGAVQVQAAEENSFRIISATLASEAEGGLARKVIASGTAPLVAGNKAAVAAQLTANGAQLLAATFEKARSITDLSLEMNFSYTTVAPAAKGTITYDWAKLYEERDKVDILWQKWESGRERTSVKFFGWTVLQTDKPKYSYNYKDVREHTKFLEENSYITFKFEERIDDERVAKIREAFLQYYLNTMTEMRQDEEAPSVAPDDGTPDAQDPKDSDIRKGQQFTYKRDYFTQENARRRKEIRLDYNTAIAWPHSVTGNLAEWYSGVRDNPSCVASVNLNDPFFQHRDIRFTLDFASLDMFEDAVNYVTVNVKKERDAGRAFEDHVTIDAKYLEENGKVASVTYARGNDRNPDVYQYQAQWSLRGGKLYPPNPRWETGSWEGVTLAPPVVPLDIDFEADLDELADGGISRVTAQIRYRQFGTEVEGNIHVSPAKKEPLVSGRFYQDPASKYYAYRLILNHKTKGKFATAWKPLMNDDYIYANIPADLLDEPVYKKAAEDLKSQAADKILDKFKDLIGG